MRIILDAPERSKEMSGTDRIALNVIRELQRIDSQNSYVVLCSRSGRIAGEVTAPNFEVARRVVLPGYLRALEGPSHALRLMRLKVRRPDLYVTFGNLATPVFNPARHALCFAFDLIPVRLPHLYLRNTILQLRFAWRIRRARKAARLVAISEYAKKELIDVVGVESSRVDVVPLGVESRFESRALDPEADRLVLDRNGLDPGYVLVLGGDEPRKNVGHVIESHRLLPTDTQRKHPLVVAGDFQAGSSLPSVPTVRWLGPIPDADLPALYRHAEVFVYVSLSEGFGLPPLEAMASGTPVIASNTTALPEVVGRAAELVDPSDVRALETALADLLRNRERRDELREAGLRRAEGFRWEYTAIGCHQIFSVVTSMP